MIERALATAKAAAIEASKVIMEIYNTDFDVLYKQDDSPVTLADKKADKIIRQRLGEAFPDHALLSEESIDDLARLDVPYCWIIDPVDGTKEFVLKTGEFTVNIALALNGESILGVVYVPVTDDMYFAVKGKGSYYEKDGKTTQSFVSDRLENLRILSSKHHKSEDFLEMVEASAPKINEILGVGSSLKGCLISKGDAECYFRFGLTSEWDTAAVQVIVEEAGGVFRQMDHTLMTYNRKDTLNRKGFYIVNKIDNILIE
jgi:3'(2'), 5'-bisphosphate nucleotidase